MPTRISFVVATYNGAAYVEQQLLSILAALGPDDEVVVSDDGSVDDTLARISAIGDARVRILAGGERLGYQANFSRAIAAATGEFVFFSDQDDICLPARVPLSLAALATAPCVCGDAVVVNENLAMRHPSHFAQRQARFGAGRLIVRPAVIGATMACRRTFLLEQSPFPRGVPHDLWLSVQAARRGALTVIREPFILYRRHGTALSATGSVSTRSIAARLRERAALVWAMVRPRRAATVRR